MRQVTNQLFQYNKEEHDEHVTILEHFADEVIKLKDELSEDQPNIKKITDELSSAFNSFMRLPYRGVRDNVELAMDNNNYTNNKKQKTSNQGQNGEKKQKENHYSYFTSRGLFFFIEHLKTKNSFNELDEEEKEALEQVVNCFPILLLRLRYEIYKNGYFDYCKKKKISEYKNNEQGIRSLESEIKGRLQRIEEITGKKSAIETRLKPELQAYIELKAQENHISYATAELEKIKNDKNQDFKFKAIKKVCDHVIKNNLDKEGLNLEIVRLRSEIRERTGYVVPDFSEEIEEIKINKNTLIARDMEYREATTKKLQISNTIQNNCLIEWHKKNEHTIINNKIKELKERIANAKESNDSISSGLIICDFFTWYTEQISPEKAKDFNAILIKPYPGTVTITNDEGSQTYPEVTSNIRIIRNALVHTFDFLSLLDNAITDPNYKDNIVNTINTIDDILTLFKDENAQINSPNSLTEEANYFKKNTRTDNTEQKICGSINIAITYINNIRSKFDNSNDYDPIHIDAMFLILGETLGNLSRDPDDKQGIPMMGNLKIKLTDIDKNLEIVKKFEDFVNFFKNYRGVREHIGHDIGLFDEAKVEFENKDLIDRVITSLRKLQSTIIDPKSGITSYESYTSEFQHLKNTRDNSSQCIIT